MKLTHMMAGAAVVALLAAGPALAGPINQDEPLGNKILDLDGGAIPSVYTLYTASFVATDASTNLTFAFREDPAFLFLDDVSLTTGASGNLLSNGGFESGPVGSSAPDGWTYLNIFGATFGGVVATNNPHSGLNNYYDGAVQAYDAITQNVSTTVGATYDLSFWLSDNSGLSTFRRISDNGDVTDTGGDGINLVVFAGGVPTSSGTPEPAAWTMMIMGFGGLGAVMRRKAAQAAAA